MTPFLVTFEDIYDTGIYHRESLSPLSPKAQAEFDREFPPIEPEDSAKRRKDKQQIKVIVEGREDGPVIRSPPVQTASPSSLTRARDCVSKRTPSPIATATITATGHGAIATATARSRNRVRAASPPPPRRSRRRVMDQ
jgi:hypothetical protein